MQTLLSNLTSTKANKAWSNKTTTGFVLGLQDAVDGQVMMGFPPEPSSYLRISHAKAAILNQYFAKMHNRQLIIRFNDMNPSIEKVSNFSSTLPKLIVL